MFAAYFQFLIEERIPVETADIVVRLILVRTAAMSLAAWRYDYE